jgi:hypothetical protein
VLLRGFEWLQDTRIRAEASAACAEASEKELGGVEVEGLGAVA